MEIAESHDDVPNSPASLLRWVRRAGLMRVFSRNKLPKNMAKLPDGSGFFIGSFPLPKDHWLYAKGPEGWDNERDCALDQPQPILTRAQRESVIKAIRYAIRGATRNGQEMDFDPDALVQNAVMALCGPYGRVPPE
jgi:hypothetical protein